MIKSTKLQSLYIELYKRMRTYIWDIETATKLANLEVKIYRAIPDVDECKRALESLRSAIPNRLLSEDLELSKALNELDEFISIGNVPYYELYQQGGQS